MKRLFIYTLFFIFCFSCKNQEKDNSAKDLSGNKNNIQDSLVNSVKDSINNTIYIDSLQKIKIAENKPLSIYSDKDGIYHLRYILEVGKVYPLFTKDVTKSTVSYNGENMTVTNKTEDDIKVTVVDFKNNKYTLKVNYNYKLIESQASEGNLSIDTRKKSPDTNFDDKMLWRINKAICENPLTIEMDTLGKILQISGIQNVHKKIENFLKGDSELKEEVKTAILQGVKESLNAENFKLQFKNRIIQMPVKGVKINENWVDNGITYQLVKADDQFAEISMIGKIPSESDSKTEGGITFKISVNGSQKGKIIFDSQSGWMNKSNSNIIVNKTESMTKDGETLKQSVKIESNIFINNK